MGGWIVPPRLLTMNPTTVRPTGPRVTGSGSPLPYAVATVVATFTPPAEGEGFATGFGDSEALVCSWGALSDLTGDATVIGGDTIEFAALFDEPEYSDPMPATANSFVHVRLSQLAGTGLLMLAGAVSGPTFPVNGSTTYDDAVLDSLDSRSVSGLITYPAPSAMLVLPADETLTLRVMMTAVIGDDEYGDLTASLEFTQVPIPAFSYADVATVDTIEEARVLFT